MTHSPTRPRTAPARRDLAAANAVECTACGQANAADRRFCTHCGDSLWRRCPQCGCECAASEQFCGQCGARYQDLVAARLADVSTAVSRATGFRDAGEYSQAVAVLQHLPDFDHPEVRDKLAEARALAASLAQEQARRRQEADEAAEQAAAWLDQRRYKEVLVRLQAIPPAFRTDAIGQQLESAESAYREIKLLRAEIAEAVEARRLPQLGPRLDRYLALQPGDERMRVLAGRVRDQAVARARAALAAADYDRAMKLLEAVPLSAEDAATGPLQAQVRELIRLHFELRHAPHADEQLLAVAERLQRLAPQDSKVLKIADQLRDRLQRGARDARSPLVPWAPAPRRSHIGPPVHWVGGFERLRPANPAVGEALRRRAGSYFVAAGLALQGLGKSCVTVNLQASSEPSGLLGKLGRLRKAPAVTAAWGLDIGPSSLKAMKLGLDERAPCGLTILACDSFPHRLNLAAPEAESRQAELIAESLRAWRDRLRPAAEEPVCTNGPAAQMLYRFLRLPPVSGQKLADAVAFETKQQIPYPLADLNWGFQVLAPRGEPLPDQSGTPSLPVVVAALRSNDARDRLQPFEQLGIPVHTLQAEPLALYNFLVFDHAPEVERPDRVVLLDIGADAVNLVIGAPDQVWFRTLRSGGNDVNRALASELKLTFAQAELLKCDFTRAGDLGAVLEILEQVSTRLVREVRRTLDVYSADHPGEPVDGVWLCGGAARQFGVLRQFWFGSRCGPDR